MRFFLFSLLLLGYITTSFSNTNGCLQEIPGYNVVKNSRFRFTVGKDNACFFAFLLPNKKIMPSAQGSGNAEENTLWYGYFMVNDPKKIYEFPKPNDIFWTSVCHLKAVSFHDMNGDNIRDVTVIGSCDSSGGVNYSYAFVFIRKGGQYYFNQDIYEKLYGFIGLTINDVHLYIKSPQTYYKILRDRYKSPELTL